MTRGERVADLVVSALYNKLYYKCFSRFPEGIRVRRAITTWSSTYPHISFRQAMHYATVGPTRGIGGLNDSQR